MAPLQLSAEHKLLPAPTRRRASKSSAHQIMVAQTLGNSSISPAGPDEAVRSGLRTCRIHSRRVSLGPAKWILFSATEQSIACLGASTSDFQQQVFQFCCSHRTVKASAALSKFTDAQDISGAAFVKDACVQASYPTFMLRASPQPHSSLPPVAKHASTSCLPISLTPGS